MTALLVTAGIAALEWAVLLYGIRTGDKWGYDRAERLGRIALERERLACGRAMRGRCWSCEPTAALYDRRERSAVAN